MLAFVMRALSVRIANTCSCAMALTILMLTSAAGAADASRRMCVPVHLDGGGLTVSKLPKPEKIKLRRDPDQRPFFSREGGRS